VGAVLIAAAVILERAGTPSPSAPPILRPGTNWSERGLYAAMAAGFLFLAALAEEIIFRGWLIQVVGAWTRNMLVMLAVNGLIFSFVHFDPDMSGFLIRCLMGAGWAWIAIRTAGIEFTTGAHLANNLLISLCVAPVSFTAKASAGVDLAAVAVEGGVIVLLVAAVELWLRARPAEAGMGAAAVRLRR
jgi:membrane protease YdiL (CAAX protease family)